MSALRFNRKGRRASTNHGWKSVNQSCHLQWVSREFCAIYPAPPLFGGKKMPAGCQGNRPLDICPSPWISTTTAPTEAPGGSPRRWRPRARWMPSAPSRATSATSTSFPWHPARQGNCSLGT